MNDFQKVLSFKRYLKDMAGIDTVLAGGCCRDTVYGVKIKDYDLFVLNENDFRTLHRRMRGAGLYSNDYTDKYGEGRGNPEYKGVFKFCLNHIPIDIILWENPASSAGEVVSKFDFNVNQYYWWDLGEVIRHPDGDKAPHIVGGIERVSQVNFDEERYNKLITKLCINV